jgi:ABC-type nitrate/sulfonate/bicarbonate transport system substrate-binding protein
MGYGWPLALLGAPLALVPLLAVAAPEVQQKGFRTVRVSTFTTDAAWGAGRAHGFFAAEGLDVEIEVTPSSTAQAQGLIAGTLDVATTAFDNVTAWSGREGVEVVAVAQSDATVQLPVFARPEIRDWADLRGRRLAVDAVDTAFALVLRRILLAHGLDFDRGDYELVAVGGTGPRLQAVLQGDTVAAIISPPTDAQAAAAGLTRLGDHRTVLPDYPGTVIAVTRSWAERNRGDLVRLLRGWRAGARWVHEHPEAALDLVMAAQGIDREAAAGRVQQLSRDGALNLAGLQSVVELRTQFGFTLPLGTDASRYYTLEYYEAASGGDAGSAS